jgi:hypothetical protein
MRDRFESDYLSAKYYSHAGRCEKKRAWIAADHKILIMVYYILRTALPDNEKTRL